MRQYIPAILAGLVLVSAPFVVAADDGADDEATYGLCTADENNEQGDNSSNGTIEETPPFENLSEEDCQNASRPGPGSGNGSDNIPDDPGGNHSPGEPGPGSGDGDQGDQGGEGGQDGQGGPGDQGDQGDDRGSDGGNQSDEGSDRRP